MKNLFKSLLFIAFLTFAPITFAQVYEQSHLLEKMPGTPTKIVGVTDEEKDAYEAKIDSVKSYFEDLIGSYKHPTAANEDVNSAVLFHFEEIWKCTGAI